MRHLLLKEEELLILAKYTVFKVKAVGKGCVVIAHGTKLFVVWGDVSQMKKGEVLTVYKDMLVPKNQPLYL